MRPPGNLDPRFKLKTFEGRLISPGWDPGVTGIGNHVLKGGKGLAQGSMASSGRVGNSAEIWLLAANSFNFPLRAWLCWDGGRSPLLNTLLLLRRVEGSSFHSLDLLSLARLPANRLQLPPLPGAPSLPSQQCPSLDLSREPYPPGRLPGLRGLPCLWIPALLKPTLPYRITRLGVGNKFSTF